MSSSDSRTSEQDLKKRAVVHSGARELVPINAGRFLFSESKYVRSEICSSNLCTHVLAKKLEDGIASWRARRLHAPDVSVAPEGLGRRASGKVGRVIEVETWRS